MGELVMRAIIGALDLSPYLSNIILEINQYGSVVSHGSSVELIFKGLSENQRFNISLLCDANPPSYFEVAGEVIVMTKTQLQWRTTGTLLVESPLFVDSQIMRLGWAFASLGTAIGMTAEVMRANLEAVFNTYSVPLHNLSFNLGLSSEAELARAKALETRLETPIGWKFIEDARGCIILRKEDLE